MVKHTKETLKESLKIRFGERYLEFMQDFSNISLRSTDLHEKWNVSLASLSRWCEVLGYTHTFSIKRKLRDSYRVMKRVKARQETSRQIYNILTRRQNSLLTKEKS